MSAYPDVVLRETRQPLTGSGAPLTAGAEAVEVRIVPVSYWRLEEASGSVLDLGPDALTGTVAGGVTTRVPGAVRGSAAMTFDGTTGKVTFAPTRLLRQTISVEAWVKCPASSGLRPIWSNRSVASAGTPVFYVGSHDLGVRPAIVTGFATSPVSVTGVRGLRDDLWHHVIWTNDGATTNLYIDGIVDRTLAQTSPIPVTARIESVGWDYSGAIFWPGSLDEVAIYTYVLTPENVAAHYAARQNNADWVGSGGVRVSGNAAATAIQVAAMMGTGGLRASGTAAMRATTSRTASGGVAISGAALWGRQLVATGGVQVSGRALIGLAIVARGGVLVGGYAVAHGPVTVRIQGDVTLHRAARAGVRVQRTVAGPVTIGRGALSEAA